MMPGKLALAVVVLLAAGCVDEVVQLGGIQFAESGVGLEAFVTAPVVQPSWVLQDAAVAVQNTTGHRDAFGLNLSAPFQPGPPAVYHFRLDGWGCDPLALAAVFNYAGLGADDQTVSAIWDGCQ